MSVFTGSHSTLNFFFQTATAMVAAAAAAISSLSLIRSQCFFIRFFQHEPILNESEHVCMSLEMCINHFSFHYVYSETDLERIELII